ncbi:sulfatase-like hydrolase/transferase [Pedobacter sp. HMF7647]|uniref:Sulfatase-like hydrolase/transferase n=1 Tax=Hufsiella arboris TaxID=2695275 RepID=A0A7K1YBE3_9SPHI|nr:sulfatase-like hydrolase/transferase [Hufsiella arboris]MXV51895.1 sulfatase-like hydrolase/transferase [Hufsiella arboris]
MSAKKNAITYSIIAVLLISGFTVLWLFWPFASESFAIIPDRKQIREKELFLSQKASSDPGYKQPNIIILLADDLGKTDIPLYGNQVVETPNIDKLASEGATFTEAYVTAPICSPSRAGLVTGRYQQRFGYEFQPANRYMKNRLERFYVNRNIDLQELEFKTQTSVPDSNAINQQGLPEQEITIADLLRKNGYATAVTGKWHLGFSPQFSPIKHGFDYFYGFDEAFSWYTDTATTINVHHKGIMDSHIWENGNSGTSQKQRNGKSISENEFYTFAIAREATHFIDQNKSKPFLLYVPFNAPHTPFQAIKKDIAKYQAKGVTDLNHAVYYSLISGLDSAVGKIQQKVTDLGLDDNTIFIFLSDNGGATYTHATTNAPLKGGKMSLYEGGINVPFVVKWKGHVAAGTQYKNPVTSLDIFATAAAASHSSLPQRSYDGVDLIPFLSGAKTGQPHEVLYWRAGKNKAVRKGDWKLVLNLNDNITALYNLANDKAEKINLAAKNPEKVKELKNDLTDWEKGLKNPLWPGTGYYKNFTDDKPDRFEI